MAVDIQKRTQFFLKDLHAREYMRLGIYRQVGSKPDHVDMLRERKSRHEAFLRDLLRKRGINPAWYAWYFYIIGHCFGFFSRFLPFSLLDRLESTLEFWLLMRYKNYYRKMSLDASLRSMVESLELKRMTHDEPAPDAILLLENYIKEQEKALPPR